MIHIEEHILELYVLGSKKVEDRRSEIAAHLKECAGCKALVDEMTAFYQDAGTELSVLHKSGAPEQKALVRTRRNLAPFEEKFPTPMPIGPATPMGKLRYFVYKHPFVAGGGTFAFGAAAVMALSLLKPGPVPPVKDLNPDRFLYNFREGTLGIFNKEDEKLWQILSPDVQQNNSTDESFKKHTTIHDLDNDGTNEVLTSIAIAGESDADRSLHIYESNKVLRWKKEFHAPFKYANRIYTPDFGANEVFVGALVNSGRPEIFVSAASFRSPCFLARLDNRGDEIGRYWHFGTTVGFDTVDVNHDGKPEIVIWGVNDTKDSTHEEFGVIIVLDPARIIGDKKSSATPGFEFEQSDAELYYIRIPWSDMTFALGENSFVSRMARGTDNTIMFTGPNSTKGLRFSFYYDFSTDMRILRVKSDNGTDKTHDILAKQGKVKGKIDDKYLENLKNGVRYWDGKEWRKERVMVNHDLQLTGVSPPK